MQEVHCTRELEKIMISEWGGRIVFSHADSKSCGCAILFKPRLNAQIEKISSDEKGRYIIVDAVINQKEITIACLYAPNNDEPKYFEEIFKVMTEHKSADKIIGGDFNLVLDKKLDSANRKRNNIKAKNVLKSFMGEFMIVDPWRE